MTEPNIIHTILKDTNYHLSRFKENEIEVLCDNIFIKTVKGEEKPFVNCIVRDKSIQLKPEEVVRQLYAARLINELRLSQNTIGF